MLPIQRHDCPDDAYLHRDRVRPYIEDGVLHIFDGCGTQRDWGAPECYSGVSKLAPNVIAVRVRWKHRYGWEQQGYYFVEEDGEWQEQRENCASVLTALIERRSAMKHISHKLKSLNELMDREAPFRTVTRIMYANGKAYMASVGHKPWGDPEAIEELPSWRATLAKEHEVVQSTGKIKFNIKEKTAHWEAKFSDLVGAVEKAVNEEVDKMKEYITQAMEDKIPDIMMDRLTGNEETTLKDSFCEMVDERILEWKRQIWYAPCPFTRVEQSDKVAGPYGAVAISIQKDSHGSDSFEVGNVYYLSDQRRNRFKEKLEIWDSREAIEAYIRNFVRRLDRAR